MPSMNAGKNRWKALFKGMDAQEQVEQETRHVQCVILYVPKKNLHVARREEERQDDGFVTVGLSECRRKCEGNQHVENASGKAVDTVGVFLGFPQSAACFVDGSYKCFCERRSVQIESVLRIQFFKNMVTIAQEMQGGM